MSDFKTKSFTRRFLIVVLAIVGLFAFFVVISWPMILGETRELTGLDFELMELSRFDDTGARGEGTMGWLYRIPESVAEQLDATAYPLTEYPMWSAHRFSGYRQIRWTRASQFNSHDAQLVSKSVFGRAFAIASEPEKVQTLDGATNYAKWLMTQENTYISCWYYWDGEHSVSNYFVYVLNLDERILVKLTLLT